MSSFFFPMQTTQIRIVFVKNAFSEFHKLASNFVFIRRWQFWYSTYNIFFFFFPIKKYQGNPCYYYDLMMIIHHKPNILLGSSISPVICSPISRAQEDLKLTVLWMVIIRSFIGKIGLHYRNFGDVDEKCFKSNHCGIFV